MLGIIIIIIVLIIVFIFFYKIYRKNDEKENIKEVIGEIYCIFNIEKINTIVQILGNDFKISDFSIYIDNEKMITIVKEYKFKEIGKHKIKIELYEDINMDYMFKNISYLTHIEKYFKKYEEKLYQ